jgi:hypothetical protein
VTVKATPFDTRAPSIGKAIDKARANDTLKIHGGTYREDVTIDKPLELMGVDGRPEIDGRCKTRYTIRARSKGVSLTHLKVVGADEGFGPDSAEVDWHNQPTGTAQDLVVHNTCDAEYGINVFSSGPVEVSDNRITGGKIYSVKTRDVKSRVAEALRLAARSLWHAQNYFGDLYRRWKARLGGPKAITAMAHKLARVLWHLLKYKEPFNPEVFAKEEEKMKRQKLARLQNMAASLNYQLIPNQ